MPRIISKPKCVGRKFTVDIEVNGSHTYQIRSKSNRGLVTHNTVSLLNNVPPGIHFPMARYYIRRVRLMKKSPMIKDLLKSQ